MTSLYFDANYRRNPSQNVLHITVKAPPPLQCSQVWELYMLRKQNGKWMIQPPSHFLLLTLLFSSQTPYPFTSWATSFISLNIYLCSQPLSPNSWHPILSTQQSSSQILSPFLQFPLPALSLNSLLFFPIPTRSLKGLLTLSRKSPFFFSQFHSLTIHSSYVSCPSSEGLQCVRVFLYKVDAFGVQGRSDGWSDKLRSILLIPGLGDDLGEVTLLALSAGIGINALLLCSEKKFVSWGLTLLLRFPGIKGLFVDRSSSRSICLAEVSLTEMSAAFPSKRFVELVDRAVRSTDVISDDESHSLYAVLAGKIDSSPLA